MKKNYLQSVLPEYLEKNTIEDLTDFDNFKYTLPWAISIDEMGLMWINGSYPFYRVANGNATLKIKKEGKFVLVDEKSIGNNKYKKSNGRTIHEGTTLDDYLPVVLV
jgi:hypothetical protein